MRSYLLHIRQFAGLFFRVGIGIAFCALTASAIKSGYSNAFDIDELYHSQVVYLIAHGYTIYKSFWLIGYTPLLHWLLLPVYIYTHFTFDTLYAGRYVLIVLFLLRMALFFNLIRMLWGKRAAFIGLSLLLLDSLTIFSGMQIRPDNLMVVLLLVGLNLLVLGDFSVPTMLLSGAFLALSVISLSKIAPAVFFFGFCTVLFLMKRKNARSIFSLIVGGTIPILLFFSYFIFDGRLKLIIDQIFVYPPKFFMTFQYPVPFGFFYRPGNDVLFGLPGNPPQWIFLWILFIIMGGGVFFAFETVVKAKPLKFVHIFLIATVLSLASQFYFIANIQSPFLQYYIPVHFFGEILGAFAIDGCLRVLDKRVPSLVGLTIISVIFFYFSYYMTIGNMNRSTHTSEDIRQTYESIWAVVPPNEPIYPHVMFRPIAYPVLDLALGDASPAFRAILPDFMTIFQQRTLKYVYFDSYTLSFYPDWFRQYITDHYVPSEKNTTVFVLK